MASTQGSEIFARILRCANRVTTRHVVDRERRAGWRAICFRARGESPDGASRDEADKEKI
jgi:hypothetical protein